MDIATPGLCKELKRVLSYAIQTKRLKMKIRPEEKKNERVELPFFQIAIIVETNQIKEV